VIEYLEEIFMDEVSKLHALIDGIDKISDEEWMLGLEDRKIKELEFHDRDRENMGSDNQVAQETEGDTFEKFYGNKKYYQIVNRSTSYVRRWIELESKGKIFLDYACGNGSNARLAAESGAALSLGFDISGVSVANAKQFAKDENIDNARFFQADAENTKLADNSIDVILCSGMLHHLDLSYAMPELRRILKPGGKVLAVEALDYNPAIKLYRMITPAMRTDWEKAHILSLKDITFAKRFFKLGEVKHWHVVGYAAGKFPFLMPFLDLLDRVLEKIPGIQIMSWMFTFELIKDTER
jgi:ubiquinone/menaquinone biosynthesis C-methylase UbiE